MPWQPIKTAPKDRYLLGWDPALKRPFVMIWNVPEQQFVAAGGMGDETPTHWAPLMKGPGAEPELSALRALAIVHAWEALDDMDDPLAQKSLSDLFAEEGLSHLRDEVNMRHGSEGRFVRHEVLCFTFEDGSRLVKFTQYTDPPTCSEWAAIPAGESPY